MNKLKLLFALTVFSIITVSCEKNNGNDETNVRDKFLVDKIYDYDDNLLGEYFYDNNNRLIKAITTNLERDHSWKAEFEYENGRVSKIIHDSWYESHFFYDSKKQLIRRELHASSMPMSEDFLYENGHVVGIRFDDSLYDTYAYFYDNSMNVTKHIRTVSGLTFFPTEEDPVLQETDWEFTSYFEYDNRPKPNFGIDHLFTYDPLPVYGSWERNLSKNNITEITLEENGRYVEKSTWTYTYNENGLPSTIEIKHESSFETLKPVFLRITYKQIE